MVCARVHVWVPCLWEVIQGLTRASFCLFASSRPSILCLQCENSSPLLLTEAALIFPPSKHFLSLASRVLFHVVPHAAGGGLPGDGDHRPDAGGPTRPPV